jgi:hypothetical protein
VVLLYPLSHLEEGHPVKSPLFSSSRVGGLLYFFKYHKSYLIRALNFTPGETRTHFLGFKKFL